MNFAKFLRTPFLTEHLRWLLLSLLSYCYSEQFQNFQKTLWLTSAVESFPKWSYRSSTCFYQWWSFIEQNWLFQLVAFRIALLNNCKYYGVVVLSLSLLYNFIQQSLNFDSAELQILASCQKFWMVRISGNDPTWK